VLDRGDEDVLAHAAFSIGGADVDPPGAGPFGRLRLAGAFMRAVLCVIFPVGLAWVLVSRHNRSLQDVVLRTSVVYDWLGEPNPAAPAGERG